MTVAARMVPRRCPAELGSHPLSLRLEHYCIFDLGAQRRNTSWTYAQASLEETRLAAAPPPTAGTTPDPDTSYLRRSRHFRVARDQRWGLSSGGINIGGLYRATSAQRPDTSQPRIWFARVQPPYASPRTDPTSFVANTRKEAGRTRPAKSAPADRRTRTQQRRRPPTDLGARPTHHVRAKTARTRRASGPTPTRHRISGRAPPSGPNRYSSGVFSL